MHLIVRALGETYCTPICLLGPILKKSATTYFIVAKKHTLADALGKNRIKTMDTGVSDFKHAWHIENNPHAYWCAICIESKNLMLA